MQYLNLIQWKSSVYRLCLQIVAHQNYNVLKILFLFQFHYGSISMKYIPQDFLVEGEIVYFGDYAYILFTSK